MAEKMICSDCGCEMNQHAEKFVYLEGDASGSLDEIHTCPNCGKSDSRSGARSPQTRD